jgi:transcriptional regulator with XRE-family HTH domain
MAREEKPQVNPDAETDEIIRVIARRFAEARKKRGLTQKELGQLAGVAQSRIFELEQGTANITVRTLINMSRHLGVDPRSFFPDFGPIGDAETADAFAKIRQLADGLLHVVKSIDERSKSDGSLKRDIDAVIGLAQELAVRRVVPDDDHG